MHHITVMIVEDQTVVAMDIEEILQDLECTVVGKADHSQKALEIFAKKKPRLVIMDINLGEGDDGITTAEKILEMDESTKIIYLTAFSDDETLDRAAATHPSAYIIKPFKKADVKAALRLTFRESMLSAEAESDITKSDHLILHDGYTYSAKDSKLYLYEELVILGKKETKLLRLLIDHIGEVVTLETIDTYIWEGNSVDDNNRRNLIYRLRCKLGNRLIETIPKIGCKLKI